MVVSWTKLIPNCQQWRTKVSRCCHVTQIFKNISIYQFIPLFHNLLDEDEDEDEEEEKEEEKEEKREEKKEGMTIWYFCSSKKCMAILTKHL